MINEVTAGPWDYFVGNANGRGRVRVEAANSSEDAGEHICSFPRGAKGEAHAALVAEAGTILHDTGLTPRGLAEQRAEFLTVVRYFNKAVHDARDALEASGIACPASIVTAAEKARAAFAKVEAGERARTAARIARRQNSAGPT